ncbi:gp138.2 [Caviid betaherpesvirus 2]|uniref:Gp138 protein n=1 Tax=Guinea pig cytomegalovirus (strain 22122) TaxID=103920 RepID=B7TQ18_GPCMV|nr:gp138.2 [Caviid betaherpesvirus 2]AGE11591.1 gp138.2 [Caviid betaherpesvirus 2]AIL83976.1 gp138.2 [BAC cloning vector GPN13BACdenovo_preserved(MM)]BAJ78577.1 gp138 [Caviid betaherpesvirus 2]
MNPRTISRIVCFMTTHLTFLSSNLYVRVNDTVWLSCVSSAVQNKIEIRSSSTLGEELHVTAVGDDLIPIELPDGINCYVRKYSDHNELLVTFKFIVNRTGKYHCFENDKVVKTMLLLPHGTVKPSTLIFYDTLWVNCTVVNKMLNGTMYLVNESGKSMKHDIFCDRTRSYIYNTTKLPGFYYVCSYILNISGLAITQAKTYLNSSSVKTFTEYRSDIKLTCAMSLNGQHPSAAYWDRYVYANVRHNHPKDLLYYHNECGYPHDRYDEKDSRLKICSARHFIFTDYFHDNLLSVYYEFNQYRISNTLQYYQPWDPNNWEWNITIVIEYDLRRYGTYMCGICNDNVCYVNTFDVYPKIYMEIFTDGPFTEVKCILRNALPHYYDELLPVPDVVMMIVPPGQNISVPILTEGDLYVSSSYTNASVANEAICKLLIGDHEVVTRSFENVASVKQNPGTVIWPVSLIVITIICGTVLLWLYRFRISTVCNFQIWTI